MPSSHTCDGLLSPDLDLFTRAVHTKYSLFEHDVTGAVHVACERYHLPDLVSAHVDLVLPTIRQSCALCPSYTPTC